MIEACRGVATGPDVAMIRVMSTNVPKDGADNCEEQSYTEADQVD